MDADKQLITQNVQLCLRDFDIARVIANGEIVVEDGKFLPLLESPKYPDYMYGTVKLRRPVTPGDFNLHAPKGKTSVRASIIGAVDLSLYTQELIATLKVLDGVVQPNQGRNILRISMIDRHGGSWKSAMALSMASRLQAPEGSYCKLGQCSL